MESFNASQGAFRSRRSYPSLNHISLAPLTPRFPLDDEEGEAADYFASRNEQPVEEQRQHQYHARTSYLSSLSVPGTPSLLSHSRGGSPTRSRSRAQLRLSETDLQAGDFISPLHHHHHHNGHQYRHRSEGLKKKKGQNITRPDHDERTTAANDPEWMLRAGIALAASTREEKGQSWLVKRESSTSLVSQTEDDHHYENQHRPHHRRSTDRSRSGMSTPAAFSRGGSHRGSRVDLAMTPRDLTISTTATRSRDGRLILPDFVDEEIRAEMASVERRYDDEEGLYLEEYNSIADVEEESYDTDAGSEEAELDEREMQRLTHDRGFGLGRWIDRLVEWTLFGVDDWPAESAIPSAAADDPFFATGVDSHSRAIPEVVADDANGDEDHVSEGDGDDEGGSIASESAPVGEMAGEEGGWQDAGWLLRVVKRTMLT
ncbi:hypothetical protein ASPZODRAFT_723792 [Penicilliopsis zonata CBS 506.65]|uniref:Uncharacterized protein n=1 Tax=Penicilliopsis zonata CBS 506.65 TaxID=1073090 RepID=A0A1L9SC93_9EURO|nr:hypothetical protein ASPZODRAFT_723792 [Penicilliopsis zonata CBS 506.65]OJJ44717.1 hypothetical protein ASPZODRAFT_723792 [Penicilliopsis zonata CBS 506.65]